MKLEAIQPTLDWLEAGAPHVDLPNNPNTGFHMRHFYWKQNYDSPYDYQNNDCGTVCCAAGHVMVANSLEHNQVHTFLEMTQKDYYDLFYPEGIKLDSITPQRLAAVIRNYIETGKVNYD